MNYARLAVILFAALLAVACGRQPSLEQSAAAEPDVIEPQPIPPGFDFPANRQALQALVDANDIPAMRTHAWNVWAGMTVASHSQYQGQALPIWETWLSTNSVFTDPPTEHPQPDEVPDREFSSPSQFFHVAQAAGTTPSEPPSGLVGFNKFDPQMVAYLWEGHPAPDAPAQEFFYTSKQSLTALNATWSETTPLADRKVSDAPNPAMELKPVMLWVDASQLTALPFWQGPNASTAPDCAGVSIEQLRHPKPGQPATKCHPEPNTWTHCVLIDPAAQTTELSPATQDQFDAADKSQAPQCSSLENAQYGGLNMLYNFKLSAAEAAAFKQAQGGNAEAGDFAVLVAMHVNTKEIVDWTWQTFWWQGGQIPPQDYPGGMANLTSDVQAPWSYYSMCTAYSQTTQPDNQGDMRVCFNPFLETSTGIPDGLRSNCVTCHGTARIPQPGNFYPPTYDMPVNFGDPAYFAGTTKTDFSWAIPLNPKD